MIAHLAITNFWTQVEAMHTPTLKQRPFVIANHPSPQSVIINASNIAMRYGVFKGMTIYAAQRLIPNLTVVQPNLPLYQRASAAISNLANHYSPLVENNDCGSLFLDFSHGRYLQTPQDASAALFKNMRHDFGLAPLVTLADSKVANQVAAKLVAPGDCLFLPPGTDRAFLAPQNVGLLPEIGPKRYERCHLLSIFTIGELAHLSGEAAIAAFGKVGGQLVSMAQGIDAYQLCQKTAKQEIGQRYVMPVPTNDVEQIQIGLRWLAIELSRQLREQDLSARNIKLQVIYSDLKTGSRQNAGKVALWQEQDLFKKAVGLLQSAMERRVAIKALGLAVNNLGRGHHQLALDFSDDDGSHRRQTLQEARNRIVDKFGAKFVI